MEPSEVIAKQFTILKAIKEFEDGAEEGEKLTVAEICMLLDQVNKDLRMQSIQEARASKPDWRDEPATAAQLSTMEKLHIPVTPGLTKGQASELIGLKIPGSNSIVTHR